MCAGWQVQWWNAVGMFGHFQQISQRCSLWWTIGRWWAFSQELRYFYDNGHQLIDCVLCFKSHAHIQICGKHYRRRHIFPADSRRPPTSRPVPEPEMWVWTRRSATFRVPRFALKPLPLLHQVSFIWLPRCWSNCEAESIFSSCSAGSAAEITWTAVRSGRKNDGRGINLYFPVLQLL